MASHSLGSFGKEMRRRAGVVDREAARALTEASLDFVQGVAQATPILTGQAQANWLVNIGGPFPYYRANEYANDGWRDSLDWARQALKGLRSDMPVHITNNVPYIVQLNRGTSKQAPALFVQTTLLAVQYRLKGFKINWN